MRQTNNLLGGLSALLLISAASINHANAADFRLEQIGNNHNVEFNVDGQDNPVTILQEGEACSSQYLI